MAMADNVSKMLKGKEAKEAPKPATAKAPKPKKNIKAAQQTIDSLISAEDAVKFDESIVRGSMSDSLEYVAALGDPSQLDNAEFTKENEDGTKTKVEKTFSRIIGYRFKVLKDVKVPDFGTTERFNGPRLNDAADTSNWRLAKAGETVDLTRVEVLALLASEEFDMVVTGGEHTVTLQIAYARLANSDPQSASDLPNVQLGIKKTPEISSIKELPIIDVLDYEPDESGKTFAQGKKTIKPEFADTKFAYRAIVPPANSGGRRRSKASTNNAKNKANMISATKTLFARLNQNQGK